MVTDTIESEIMDKEGLLRLVVIEVQMNVSMLKTLMFSMD